MTPLFPSFPQILTVVNLGLILKIYSTPRTRAIPSGSFRSRVGSRRAMVVWACGIHQYKNRSRDTGFGLVQQGSDYERYKNAMDVFHPQGTDGGAAAWSTGRYLLY